MKNRKLAMVVCLVFTLSMFFTACGKSEDTATANKSSAEQSTATVSNDNGSTVTEPGTFPLTKEKVTISVMVKQFEGVKDFSTNAFTKELENLTNVKINWSVVPKDGLKEKVNIVLASQDIPDVFMDCGITPSQQMTFGKQGVFVPLNNYIEKYGVEFKKMVTEKPWVKDIITLPDGNIYDLPRVNECYHCTACHKLFMYKPWLDKLGLQMPTTTDEFYQVLKAFKEKDPNANGKKDEIPLSGSEKSWNSDVKTFLMNAFVYNTTIDPNNPSNIQNNYVINNGKFEPVFVKNEWKEGLKYINKLYKEGLIAPESFTQDGDQLMRMGTQETNILGAAPGGSRGCFTKTLDNDKKREYDFAIVPPLKGPNGVQTVSLEPFSLTTGVYIITNKCKVPEIAFRMGDALYGGDLTIKSVMGVEGKNWRKANSGEVNGFDEPAKWFAIENKDANEILNDGWDQAGPSYRSAEWRAGWASNPASRSANDLLDPETKKYMEQYKPDIKTIVPPLVFDDKQSEQVPALSKTINDYVNECTVRFITGDMNIDKDWDQYVKELDNMKLADLTGIYQTVYNATHK